ncbi:hypothetical protein BKA70DRAFT_1216052 [Coprinopsis sp. MPI-PUGE-AT-0042]|nr:hypothetical protein BKA70DRAFT_1216052 [Coprinopsis sp. MPI-PUGE-AT-0042]
MIGKPQYGTNIPANPSLPSLPSELIAEVMKACFSDALDHKERLFFINLRSVCRSWRATAFSTPDLWAGLSITLSNGLHRVWRDTPADRSIVRWLDRAGDRPLTFKIIRPLATFHRGCEALTINEVELVRKVYASALRGNRNWYRLHLPTMEEDLLPSAFLEQFEADRLASLQATDSVEESNDSVGGPWKTLKHLRIDLLLDCFDSEQERPLASNRLDFHAPSLDSLDIVFTDMGDPWGFLSTGRLTLINYANCTLDVVTLPNLRHLSLRSLAPKHDNVGQLVSFLSRSECHQLQELGIYLTIPLSQPESWRKYWAPAYEMMNLKEKSIRGRESEAERAPILLSFLLLAGTKPAGTTGTCTQTPSILMQTILICQHLLLWKRTLHHRSQRRHLAHRSAAAGITGTSKSNFTCVGLANHQSAEIPLGKAGPTLLISFPPPTTRDVERPVNDLCLSGPLGYTPATLTPGDWNAISESLGKRESIRVSEGRVKRGEGGEIGNFEARSAPRVSMRLVRLLRIHWMSLRMMAENPQHDTHIPDNPFLPSLPSELVAEIMKTCFSDALDHQERLFFTDLRSVSRTWRATAFSTPDLWAGLSVTLSDEFLSSWRNDDADRSILRWLDRAGDRPLTFKVVRESDPKLPLANTPRRDALNLMEVGLLRLLYGFILWKNRNWFRVHLPSVREGHLPSTLFQPFDVDRLPSLPGQDSVRVQSSRSFQHPWETLKHLRVALLIDWSDTKRSEKQWPLPGHHLGTYAPSLISLDLDLIYVSSWGSPPASLAMRVNHDTLRKLVLSLRSGRALTDTVQIIRDLPLLEDLSINIMQAIRSSLDEMPPPITHANIQRLILVEYGNTALNYLHLNNLRHLSLQRLVPKNHDVTLLSSFFSRSQCHQLQELSIHLKVPQFKPGSWRKHWAPAYEMMGLKEGSIREARGAIHEGTWIAL